MPDAKRIKDEIVAWIRDYFEKNAPGCVAVIGISGGKDSSTCAALCAEALGKDRVLGVLLPCGEQSDIDASYTLVKHLGIPYCVLNIQNAFEAVTGTLSPAVEPSRAALQSLPARLRAVTLYAVSQSQKPDGRVVNTCNLSEDWVGYFTRWGDGAGDLCPLGSLTVTEVKAVARVLGLPEALIEKAPADGLCGKTDEDNLGFSYAVLDRYIRTGVCDDDAVRERIDKMHAACQYKLRMSPAYVPAPELL